MPKNSGQQGNRSIGLDHQCGKGDKNRVTDVKAYCANYDEIDWHHVEKVCDKARRLLEDCEWRMGL